MDHYQLQRVSMIGNGGSPRHLEQQLQQQQQQLPGYYTTGASSSMAGGSPLFPNTVGRVSRAPLRKLSEDEAGEVDYAFDRLSEGQDGEVREVTPRQLKIALRAMGFPVKKVDVRELLRDAGLDATAPLDLAAFREVCATKLLTRTPSDEVARAFQLFDIDGAGRIGQNELRAIAKQLQVDITLDELRDMIDEFDGDGDGFIDSAEFAAIMAALDG